MPEIVTLPSGLKVFDTEPAQCGGKLIQDNTIQIDAKLAELEARSTDKTYQYEQLNALSVWNVVHNMNKHPSVLVIDSQGDVCEGFVQFVDLNTIRLTFSQPLAGVAYFN